MLKDCIGKTSANSLCLLRYLVQTTSECLACPLLDLSAATLAARNMLNSINVMPKASQLSNAASSRIFRFIRNCEAVLEACSEPQSRNNFRTLLPSQALFGMPPLTGTFSTTSAFQWSTTDTIIESETVTNTALASVRLLSIHMLFCRL